MLEDDSELETVAIDGDDLYIAAAGAHSGVETPWLQATDDAQTRAVIDSYRDRVGAARLVDEPVAPRGWTALLELVKAHFGPDARADFDVIAGGLAPVGTAHDSLSLYGIVCLVAAKHEYLQRDITEFARDGNVGSVGSYSQLARALDDAGGIDREDEPDGTVGRPPKRLQLAADLPADPAAYGPFVLDRLR